MTEQRPRLDHLNDEQLDQLYGRLEAAEAERDQARGESDLARRVARSAAGDAADAMAAVQRARDLAGRWNAGLGTDRTYAHKILAALDATSPDGAEQRDNAFAIARALGKVIPQLTDDDEPLVLPRDAVQALHDLTARLLDPQPSEAPATEQDPWCGARAPHATHRYMLGGKGYRCPGNLDRDDAEHARPSEALRLSQQRLDQVLADRERERHVLTGKMRENEQLRGQVDQLTTRLGEYADRGIVNGQRADQTEAALIKARRRIGELATSLDQAHDGNSGLWRAHAESVSKAGELQAAIDRVRALHQPVTSVAAAEAGIAPDCGTCDTQPYPCPTIRALDAAEPS